MTAKQLTDKPDPEEKGFPRDDLTIGEDKVHNTISEALGSLLRIYDFKKYAEQLLKRPMDDRDSKIMFPYARAVIDFANAIGVQAEEDPEFQKFLERVSQQTQLARIFGGKPPIQL